MSYGLKVSKEGFGIGTAAVKDQVFNSDHSNFKIVAEGLTTITTGTDPFVRNYGTITHNLGYVPAFFAYAQLYGSSDPYSYMVNSFEVQTGNGVGFYGQSGTTDIVFEVGGVGFPVGTVYTAYIYYYICTDPAK